MLETGGVGTDRIIQELNRMLRATNTKFYQDKCLGEFTDNATRMRALELLADLHGKRKADLTLHTDVIEVIPAPKPEEHQPDED